MSTTGLLADSYRIQKRIGKSESTRPMAYLQAKGSLYNIIAHFGLTYSKGVSIISMCAVISAFSRQSLSVATPNLSGMSGIRIPRGKEDKF